MSHRTVHWRWEYRLRYRPHVLLVADAETCEALRLPLQARWLISQTSEPDMARMLARMLLPSRMVLDAAITQAVLLIERLQRDHATRKIPVLFLGRDSESCTRAQEAGAQAALVTNGLWEAGQIRQIQTALFNAAPMTQAAV